MFPLYHGGPRALSQGTRILTLQVQLGQCPAFRVSTLTRRPSEMALDGKTPLRCHALGGRREHARHDDGDSWAHNKGIGDLRTYGLSVPRTGTATAI